MDDEYLKLIDKIDNALDGANIELIVPALSTFLARAGYLSGMEKKRFVAHVVNSIDRMFDRAQRQGAEGTDDE